MAHAIRPTGNWIQTRGLRIHYLQRGRPQPGGADPVILVHGFPETSWSWRHQLAALGDAHAVFAPDNRGFGATDRPGARVSRELLAADLVDFMDALGIERAAVVGHDWGGIIAFKLAIDHPHRVSRLALLDTLCTVWHPLAIHGYWFKAEPLPEQFFAAHHRGFIEAVVRGRPATPLPGPPASPWRVPGHVAGWADAEDLDHYVQAFADPAAHAHAISYYRYALPFHVVHADPQAHGGERYQTLSEAEVGAMWRHPDGLLAHPLHAQYMDYGPHDRHKRFVAPALWLMSGQAVPPRGAGDAVPRGTPFLDQFSRYFPDLRAAAIDGGHFFPEENPAATNRELLRFLAGADR